MSAIVSESWFKESIASDGEDFLSIAGDGEDGVSGHFPIFLLGFCR
jgi:hypothetical protein